VDLSDHQAGIEDHDRAKDDQRDLREQVGDRENDVQLGRLAEAADVDEGEDRDNGGASDQIGRASCRERV